jgi:outer membrane autotransporter protein
MKKLFIIPSLILTIVSSTSFAKSEGTYVGLDIVQSNVDMTFIDLDNNLNINNSDDSIGYGLNIGHAISLSNIYNGLYIAPNAYFNFNEVDTTVSAQGISQTTEIENSYGLNIDLGYDIDEKFSVYASAGYVEFKVKQGVPSDNSDIARSDNSQSLSYGVGVKYNLDDRLSFRLAYESFSQETNGLNQGRVTHDFDVDVIKLGAAYSF